jgi:hypothetical protein
MTRDELTDSLLRPLRQRQLCVTAPLPFTTRNQERSQRQVEFGKKSDKQVREKLKEIIQLADSLVITDGIEPVDAKAAQLKALALDILVEL